MKFAKLRGKIVEVFGTIGKFCEEVGLSQNLLSMKLNGKSDFTYDQIVAISNALGISSREIGDYFFKR